MVEFRPYRPEDRDAVGTIWHEVGWSDRSDEAKVRALDALIAAGGIEVAQVDGAAECFVQQVPGDIDHTGTNLSMSAVTAVLTSHIGRKMGLATTLSARAIAAGAREGAAVSVLGVFETGFYDRLGFASGSYEHELTFDPATLALDDVEYRRPERLTLENADEMHAAMLGRNRPHGSTTLTPPGLVAGELGWMSDMWALGYRTDGRLTHFMAGTAESDRSYRPYFVAYETLPQLLDLLRLVKELGDQLHWFTMVEPPEIQLQDLIRGPMRQIRHAKGTSVRAHRAKAHWQLRINDLDAVVAAIDWPGEPVRFNLDVSDPMSGFNVGWDGVGGSYIVTIGSPSGIEVGAAADLPTLTTDVGPLSRILFGVQHPSTLAAIGDLSGPPELLTALDRALLTPIPHPGWDF